MVISKGKLLFWKFIFERTTENYLFWIATFDKKVRDFETMNE